MPQEGSQTWQRYAWLAGIVYVAALLVESVIATGIGLTHHETPASVATALEAHRTRALLIAYISIVYAVAFVVFLWQLYERLRGEAARPEPLSTLFLVGGVLFVTLHAVSDIGITGLLGSKLASFDAQGWEGVSFTLYFMTYALDSVGDVFGSLFMLATGLLLIRGGVRPRWVGRLPIAVAALFFFQGFGLGGVIATYGLVLDLIGFVLFLIFVVAVSIAVLRRTGTSSAALRST